MAQRGYGPAWRQLAALAIKTQPFCSICGRTKDLTVDHRDPSAKGRNDLTLADVDVLCRSHNSSKGEGFDGREGPKTPRQPSARETLANKWGRALSGVGL